MQTEEELDRKVNMEGNEKGETEERGLTPLLRETASRIRIIARYSEVPHYDIFLSHHVDTLQ